MQFGEKINDLPYTDRPGAYAVIFNERQEVAVMKTPRGFFLPGGGTDGEDPAIALAREMLEETGMGVRILQEIGKASEFCLMPGKPDGLNKQGTFYIAAFTDKLADPVEQDHELIWLSVEDAINTLTRDFQKWAVAQAVMLSQIAIKTAS
jgi:8-oxo-dGTP diphosphatase